MPASWSYYPAVRVRPAAGYGSAENALAEQLPPHMVPVLIQLEGTAAERQRQTGSQLPLPTLGTAMVVRRSRVLKTVA